MASLSLDRHTDARTAARATGRSPLERCLEELFAAYARCFFSSSFSSEHPRPRFEAELDGAFVRLVAHAPDGPRLVRRRASAYLLLAGHLWGASRSAEERLLLPASIPFLSCGSRGDGDACAQASAFAADAEARRAIFALADLVAVEAPDESVLLLRRFLEVDGTATLHPAALDRVTPSLRAKITAQSPATALALRTSSGGMVAVAKALRPYAVSSDPAARLAAATYLGAGISQVYDADNLRFLEELKPCLSAWLDEGDGAIFEIALGIARDLGAKLLYRGAYAEVNDLLDPVIAEHVALSKSLRARWECRSYLGDPRASDDLERAAKLDSSRAVAAFSPLPRDRGAAAAWTIAASTRVAAALLSAAAGVDPCLDREPRKLPFAPSAADRAALLERARVFAEEALALGAFHAEETLARASAEGSAPDHGLQANSRAVRAMIHEAAGDPAAALTDFHRARLLRIAGGLCWQSDDYGPAIRRLGASAKQALPPCFEPEWFVEEARTPSERVAAVAAWSDQPWRTLPPAPDPAAGALAYALLHGVIAHGAPLWRAAREAGVDLCDRVAFAARALPYLDRYHDRRDARRLAGLLDTAHLTAFLGAETTLQQASPEGGRALSAWVRGLVEAERIDETVVLAGLSGAPWERLRACLDERAGEHDRLRDLFDLLVAEGLDACAVATVLRAYEPLLTGDHADWEVPLHRWRALAEPLCSLDADRVAPVLIAWTRSGQRIPAAWGMQTLHVRWLWPLYYVWSAPRLAPFLEEVERGGLDNGKRLTRAEIAARRACFARLRQRLGTHPM